jgi:hypothetical protein
MMKIPIIADSYGSSSVLTEDQKQYPRWLPVTAERTICGTRFHLCKATAIREAGRLELKHYSCRSQMIGLISKHDLVGQESMNNV